MKLRGLLPTALVACTALLASGCSSMTAGEDPERTITAAFYPLAWVSEQVAGDDWKVNNLTHTGGDPHDLSIGLAETAELEQAALVVISRGLQPGVDDTVDSVAEGDVLDAAEIVGLLPAEDTESGEGHEGHDHAGHDHADEESGEESGHDGHDHGEFDPHFWHDPLRMADLADAVAAELSRLDPEGAQGYEERAGEVRTELEELDQAFATGLATCERDTVVVSHAAFGYLGRYGLHFASIAGLSPDAEATPATLGQLHELVAEHGITTVFTERLASSKMADSLAADLGIGTAVLDPLEGLTTETKDDDYLSLMRANLEALRTANGCA